MRTDSVARKVGALLQERRLTLVVAESCTGGLLATQITNISGSSAYFLGGIVAYSNAVKERLLGVPVSTLQRHGAVSCETAVAMARGARRLLRADLALSTTGIAGPTGGSPEKPVGMVYVALASGLGENCREFHWTGDRRRNREQSVRAALEWLRDYLVADAGLHSEKRS
jgi:PncC family amidohydrolase